MKPFGRHALWGGVLALLSGCTSLGQRPPSTEAGAAPSEGATTHTQPIRVEPDTLKEPPPPSVAPQVRFPNVERRTLGNGLSIAYVARSGLPLTEIMLSFAVGRASEGDKVGVARLTAELVRFSGASGVSATEVQKRLESLGAGLGVETGADHTSFRLSVMNQDVPSALDLLATLVKGPELSLATFGQLKQTERERAESKARGDFGWGNQLLVYRELFEQPTGVHPYARFDATAADLTHLELADCKHWQLEHLAPKNAELVIVGPLEAQSVIVMAERAFAGWTGHEPTRSPEPSRPTGPERLRIFVIDRPESPVSEVTAGVLAAPHKSLAWPALSVATHLLGVGPASRLYSSLQERERLAIKTSARLVPLAAAPALVMLNATTAQANTVSVARALLAHLSALASEAPKPAEVEHAVRAMTGGFLNQPNPERALAEMVAAQTRLGLELDYYDRYYAELLRLDAASVRRVVEPYFDTARSVLVVSGDAKTLQKDLSKLAPVVVVDADNGFASVRTLPFGPL